MSENEEEKRELRELRKREESGVERRGGKDTYEESGVERRTPSKRRDDEKGSSQ